jgi:hypothetical protein
MKSKTSFISDISKKEFPLMDRIAAKRYETNFDTNSK